MKLKELLKRVNTCPREAYWASLQLDSEKSFAFTRMIAFREITKEFSPSTMQDELAVRERLNQYIDDSMFFMKHEKEANVSALVKAFMEFGKFLEGSYIDYSPEDKSIHVANFNDPIEVVADFIVNDIPLVIKSKEDRFKKEPKWNLELYALTQAYNVDNVIVYCVKECKAYKCSVDDKVKLREDAIDLLESAKRSHPSPFAPNNDYVHKCEKCIYKKICIFEDIDIHEDQIKKSAIVKKSVRWTDEQKEIIFNSKEGEYRILAGAGCGKTSVLTQRMIELARDCDPRKILAITFTKAGVQEIFSKLKGKDTDIQTENFKVATFNGLCSEIIDEFYKDLGYTEKPKLIDPEVQSELIGKILDNKPVIRGLNYQYPFLTMARGAIITIQNLIDLIKRKKISTSLELYGAICDMRIFKKAIILPGGVIDHVMLNDFLNVYYEYTDYCLKHNLLDYQDQIDLMFKLKNLPEVADIIRERYCHIIIDEFQDTSNDQLIIIKDFIYKQKAGHSLLVCGDDSQSIYKFRDVDARNIIHFEEYFPKVKTLKLTKNFRSTQDILDLATSVVEKSSENIKKNLVSCTPNSKGSIGFTNHIIQVCNAVEKQLSQGYKLNEIAVLCSTRQECIQVHEMLSAKDIENVIVVGNNIKEDNQVQSMIALCKFLDDRNEDVEVNLFDLTIWLHKSDPQMFESQYVLKEYILGEYTLLLNEFVEVDEDQRYEWFMNKILSTFPSHSKGLQVVLDRENKINDHNIYRLFDFLRGVEGGRINVYTPSEDSNYDAITISTVHAAKGKEWDCVNIYAPRLCKNLFISNRKKEKVFDNESLRVLFVAITRARKELTIYDHEAIISTSVLN